MMNLHKIIPSGHFAYNGSQGKRNLYAYHEGHPKFWYQGWWRQNQSDIGKKIENWIRLCEKYQINEVYDHVPTLKFIGSRSYGLESSFENACQEHYPRLTDHRFAFHSAKDDRIYWVGSNYDAQHELSKLPKSIYLGEYKDNGYTMYSEILPDEYDFHNLDCPCHTVLWHCVKEKSLLTT